jgi:serine/threonine protein kinase/tetratricopeptide (TPR) repeat protein
VAVFREFTEDLLEASRAASGYNQSTLYNVFPLWSPNPRTSGIRIVNFPAGSRLGPYKVIALLGAGGMGEVYRAFDPGLAREVAVKVIRRVLVHDEAALDRLLREATLASALNHPNIVTIYETGVVGSDRYIAMELIEGQTLRQLAAQGLPLARIMAIARQVAEALAVAHAAQIVHRDIKPDNVMVRPDGYVKLLDFGLARQQAGAVAAGSTTGATEAGMMLGTIGYMAPEQARGEKVTAEADVFALGVLLYELVTGRHPFMAASQIGTLHALMWETPEPPSLLNPELTRAIDQLILEALQKDPRLRPGTSEVLLRLSLAHDSTVAVALSSMTIAPPRRAPRDIVGRDAELDAMLHEFEEVQRGNGRLIAVSGEAGMGKTTLVDSFIRQLEGGGTSVRVARGRCSERLAGSEAYLPILEVLDSLQRSEQLGSLSRLIRALAPSWYVQIMPPSANDSSAARLAAETVGGSQERLKREIAGLLDEVGRIQPVVICLDDMHWADPSTTDLIGYLGRRLDGMRVLIVVTSRPSDLAQARHPFLPLKLDLVARGLCREISPGFLDEAAIDRYVALQFPEHVFPKEFASVIRQRTDGNPLFMADLLRDLRRRHVLRQQDGRWTVAEDLSTLERELPESVRSLIQRKMDALEDSDRRLLAAASVQGLDFDSAIVAAALSLDDEQVEDRLERLEREHALVRFVDEFENVDRSLTLRYRFSHHVYHNAFYDSLRATRRVALSRTIAEKLVQRTGDQPGERAADIALLFEVARDGVRAAEYWNRAAQAAARLYAHGETARLAKRGLALLANEPDSTERAAAELGLQMTYGLAIKTSEGYAAQAVGEAYARARELCRRVGDPARVIPVLVGLSAHHVVSGEVRVAHDIALEMLALFQRLGEPNLQMIGLWSVGAALFHLGELESGHDHLERSLQLYDPTFHTPRVWQTGIEPGIFCRCELARTLTLRGFPDQGLECVNTAVAQARAIDHPQPLAFAQLFQLLIYLAQRRPQDVLRTYEELSTICRTHGIAQEMQWAAPLRARALLEIGETVRGIREMEAGLAAQTSSRSGLLRPYYVLLYAGALIRANRYDEVQQALDEAARVSDATSQHAYDSEHARLQGTLLLMQQGPVEAAERAFERGVAIARQQGARWLELRAARAYADFLVHANRPIEARNLLQPVVEWFTEGKDSMDFVYTEALLRTLETASSHV